MRRNESEELLFASLILLFNVTTALFSMPRKNLKTKTVNRMETDDCYSEVYVSKIWCFCHKERKFAKDLKSSVFCDTTVVVLK
ncbi:hypothetical protein CDAR_488941 [Caerostris darwini]|uniref:Secreted protein n=1 Tax=Caerostris darwini TaxID=1538125 RepID=A0AAV4VID1_9ARAC|nr:hypothetical protein CDAR_488941 [Caerostris darwini]